MSIFSRPVSDYYPESPNQLIDAEPKPHYQDWGYDVAYEKDQAGNDIPDWANTAVFRIYEGGMTEPVYVTKQDSKATFNIRVLSGQGVLIRALSTGAVETVPLQEDENNEIQAVITPGQAYSYVNTGSGDLMLHDTALPPFKDGDDIELLNPFAASLLNGVRMSEAQALSCYEQPDGSVRRVILPKEFYDRIGAAMAGRLQP